jgi:hypothetical protein
MHPAALKTEPLFDGAMCGLEEEMFAGTAVVREVPFRWNPG